MQDWDEFLGAHGIGTGNPFGGIVPLLDHTRALVCYGRKSDPSGELERGHYLKMQGRIPHWLKEAGFEGEIIVLDDDTGISAWLGRKFRADLRRQHELIESGRVGTVVAADVSRWFRDEWLAEPTQFAMAVANNNTIILTQSNSAWALLDMNNKQHRDTFIAECNQAAQYRIRFRDMCLAAKEESARAGNYTGAPLAFGWAVRPGIRRHQSPTGEAIPPRPYVYGPHKEYKLKVWEIALLPHIETYPDLRRYLIKHDLKAPPFDAKTREASFTSSCLRAIKGAYDQPFIPSWKTLNSILLEPLAVGFRLYGAGKSGRSYKNKLERMARQQGHKANTQAKDYREFYAYLPDQALWDSEEEKERITTLFRQVWAKWSPVDLETAIRSNFRQPEPNASQTAARPLIKRTSHQTRNHWAQRVYCMRHGLDATGAPVRDHPFALHAGGTAWECYRDRALGLRRGACSMWGDNNRLGRILDRHLHRALAAALDGDGILVESLGQETARREQEIATLERDLARLKAEKQKHERYLRSLQDALYDDQGKVIDLALEQVTQAEIGKYTKANITPLLMSIHRMERDCEALKLRGETHDRKNDTLGVRLTDHLRYVLQRWNELEVEERLELVRLFVAHIGVYVSDGQTSEEALVRFEWVSGHVDYLMSCRNTWRDDRPWTPEEDQVLRDLYPSDAAWEVIQAKLQPRRKFASVWHRVWQLGIGKKSGRSMVWVDALKEAERSWLDRHPDLLYLALDLDNLERCLAIGNDDEEREMCLPESSARFLYTELAPLMQNNSLVNIMSEIDTTIAEENAGITSYNAYLASLNISLSYPLLPATGMRATPDLSFDADPATGPAIYSSIIGGWIRAGGTSVSAPALAAILNLAGTAQGFFPSGSSEALRDIYVNWAYIGGFRDIVNGYNFDPMLNPIACMPGWDGVTGVGSPWGLIGLQKPF